MNLLTKIKQKFCKHKNIQWYESNQRSIHLRLGPELFKICDDCGKELSKMRLDWATHHQIVKNMPEKEETK
jgi:hypothetical protein